MSAVDICGSGRATLASQASGRGVARAISLADSGAGGWNRLGGANARLWIKFRIVLLIRQIREIQQSGRGVSGLGVWLARWRFSALDLSWICGATLLIRDDHLLLAVLLWFVGPIAAEAIGAKL